MVVYPLLPEQHLDGAFQTYSALSRMSLGESPGKDFFPYLGVGVMSFIYPFFVLAGGDLQGSLVASQFCVFLTFVLGVSLIFLLLLRRVSFVRAFTWALSLLIFLIWMRFGDSVGFFDALPDWLVNPFFTFVWKTSAFFQLGNSLRPLRLSLVFFSALILFWAFARGFSPSRGWVVSVLLVLALFWSNDIGLPLFGMLGLTWGGLVLVNSGVWSRQGWKQWGQWRSLPWVALIGYPLLGVALYVGILTVMTGGDPGALPSYNFSDVRHDQYWYFGEWSPQFRIFDLASLVTALWNSLGPFLLVLPVLFLWFCLDRTLNSWLLFFVYASLFLGGLLPSVGGHLESYFAVFVRWSGIFLVLALLVLGAQRMWGDRPWARRLANSWAFRYLSLGFVTLLLALSLSQMVPRTHSGMSFSELLSQSRLAGGMRLEIKVEDPAYVPELGGLASGPMQEVVAKVRSLPQGASILEEYWGWWNALRGVHYPQRVDSLIHALGSKRQEFLGRFRVSPPDYVVSSSKDHGEMWLTWSFAYNWWFWREVLWNYQLEGTYGHSWLWQRLAVPKSKQEVSPDHLGVSPGIVSSGGEVFWLEGLEPGYYEVELPVKFHRTSSRSLFMLQTGGFPVDPLDSAGLLSLDYRSDLVRVLVWVSGRWRHPFGLCIYGPKGDQDGLEIVGEPRVFPVPQLLEVGGPPSSW
jgi:hypothetical protein